MGSLLKLLLIASVLALLVAAPVDAKKNKDLKEESAEEGRVEEVGEVNTQDDHTAEDKVGKTEDEKHPRDDVHTEGTEEDVDKDKEEAEHPRDDQHKEGSEDDAEKHKEEAEHDDEDHITSELVELGEPPSSKATEAEHETSPTEKKDDDKHDDGEDKGEVKGTKKTFCCFSRLRKPFSRDSRCSCTQWLKHALRHSVFFRPFYDFIRASLSTLPQTGNHDDDDEHEDEEGEGSAKPSSLRDLGLLDGGFIGSGYYAGYPGYLAGYPGYYYGYPGLGLGGVPGIGIGLYI